MPVEELLRWGCDLSICHNPSPVGHRTAQLRSNFSQSERDTKDGGLNGIHFDAQISTTIGDTIAAQWVATAPFLSEPYKGSDAYITKDGYMQAMVTTFDGGALKMKK
jgi:hypothetical protein